MAKIYTDTKAERKARELEAQKEHVDSVTVVVDVVDEKTKKARRTKKKK